jgi:hypothetical protein
MPTIVYAWLIAALWMLVTPAEAKPQYFVWGDDDDDRQEVRYHRNSILYGLEVTSGGEVEISADDASIVKIAAGGFLVIEERNWLTYRSLTVRSGPESTLAYEFSLQGRATAWDDDGRRWLARVLPVIVRETALGAAARVRRILEKEGFDSALRAVRRTENNRARRVYVEIISEHPGLSSDQLRRLVRVAGEEIGSSSRLQETLSSLAARFPEDSLYTRELIEAVQKIASSSHQAEALADIIERRRIDEASALAMTRTIQSIESSSRQVESLVRMTHKVSMTPAVVSAYAEAVRSVESSSGQKRALLALMEIRTLEKSSWMEILDAVREIGSSSAQTDVLVVVVSACPTSEDAVWLRYVETVAFVESSSGQEEALTAMLNRNDISRNVLERTLGIIQSSISSSAVREHLTARIGAMMARG